MRLISLASSNSTRLRPRSLAARQASSAAEIALEKPSGVPCTAATPQLTEISDAFPDALSLPPITLAALSLTREAIILAARGSQPGSAIKKQSPETLAAKADLGSNGEPRRSANDLMTSSPYSKP